MCDQAIHANCCNELAVRCVSTMLTVPTNLLFYGIDCTTEYCILRSGKNAKTYNILVSDGSTRITPGTEFPRSPPPPPRGCMRHTFFIYIVQHTFFLYKHRYSSWLILYLDVQHTFVHTQGCTVVASILPHF